MIGNNIAIDRNDMFHSEMVAGAQFSAVFEMPMVAKVDFLPKKAIPFDKSIKTNKFENWIHFYLEDRRFECIWNTPGKYLPIFKRFSGVITPDFSIYREMPLAMQIWNTYRNRVMAYWLQKNGINIVPNIRWGDERTYSFAFEGIPKHSTVAVSTNGCIRDKLDRYYFRKGLDKMIEEVQPAAIVSYSQTPPDLFGKYMDEGLTIIHIENYHVTVRKAVI